MREHSDARIETAAGDYERKWREREEDYMCSKSVFLVPWEMRFRVNLRETLRSVDTHDYWL